MAQGDNIGIPISTSATFAENSDAIAPSQKAVKTVTDGKQATLISGTNIKTINSTSLLGSGDFALATLASPALTGTPTAPTAAVDTNTTQIATTAFVQTQIAPDVVARKLFMNQYY